MKKSQSLAPSQRKTTTLAREIRPLAEAQRRTEERMGRLEEVLAALAGAQRRTEEQVTALAEAQRRTEEQVTALAEAQRRTEETVRQLAQTVGRFSDIIGFGLEDIARVVLPGYLQRHLGIMLFGDELERRFITTNRQVIEINLYGEGKQNGEKVVVIGECKSRIRSSQVEEFADTLGQLRPHFQQRLIPVLFGYWIHPSGTEAAQRTGILLVASYQK